MSVKNECGVCNLEFKTGDLCALDIGLGEVHAECLEGCEIVDHESEQPTLNPLSTYLWGAPTPAPNPPEPRYVAQVEQTPFAHPDWFIAKRAEAESDGCTFFRFSVHPDNMGIALIEGWEKQPADQGEIRFMIAPLSTPTSQP